MIIIMSSMSSLFRSLSFAIILSALIFGCQKPEADSKDNHTPDSQEEPTPDPPVDEKNYFKADIKDVYVFWYDGSGPETLIYYESDIKEITVTSSENWCEATVLGDDANIIRLHCEEYHPTFNPDGSGGWLYAEPRSCTVQLTAGNVFSKTFKVFQECETDISVPSDPVTLSAAGESVDVLVQNNVYSWSASTDATWLTLRKKDSSTLTVTSAARPASETAPRRATVTIVNDYNSFGAKTTFTVADADADLSGEDFGYGDHTDWD